MSTGKRPTGPRTTRAATKKAAKTAPPAKRRSGRQACLLYTSDAADE